MRIRQCRLLPLDHAGLGQRGQPFRAGAPWRPPRRSARSGAPVAAPDRAAAGPPQAWASRHRKLSGRWHSGPGAWRRPRAPVRPPWPAQAPRQAAQSVRDARRRMPAHPGASSAPFPSRRTPHRSDRETARQTRRGSSSQGGGAKSSGRGGCGGRFTTRRRGRGGRIRARAGHCRTRGRCWCRSRHSGRCGSRCCGTTARTPARRLACCGQRFQCR